MRRSWLFLALLVGACNGSSGSDDMGDDPPDGSRRIRVTLGADDHEAAQVYAFSVRVSRLTLTMSDGSEIVGKPTNVDVLRGGLLLETYSDATPRLVELRFDQPPNGSGVVPGGRVAAYLSCAVQEEPFDYRGEELERVRLEADADDVKLRFTLTNLLDGFVPDDFEDAPPHHVDDDHNSELAEEIQARLGESLGVCDACGE